jgi:uncharacterized membrane protein
MNRKKYQQVRVLVILFVLAVVILAGIKNSYLLSLIGVVTGMVFLTLARSRTQIKTDEREATIQEKAARLAYAIFAPTLAMSALILLIPSRSGWTVFSKGEFAFTDAVGMILAYLSLFLIAIYAIAYYFLNRKYGGREK